MNHNLKQMNFKISRFLLEKMDKQIDAIRFRSRGQILNIALAEWLDRQGALREVKAKNGDLIRVKIPKRLGVLYPHVYGDCVGKEADFVVENVYRGTWKNGECQSEPVYHSKDLNTGVRISFSQSEIPEKTKGEA